ATAEDGRESPRRRGRTGGDPRREAAAEVENVADAQSGRRLPVLRPLAPAPRAEQHRRPGAAARRPSLGHAGQPYLDGSEPALPGERRGQRGRVVDHEQVARTKKPRQVEEAAVREARGRGVDVEQAHVSVARPPRGTEPRGGRGDGERAHAADPSPTAWTRDPLATASADSMRSAM